MRVEQQPGYVLHARPYRETSLLLECLSCDYGRIGLVARAVRCAKPRFSRAVLQPLVPLRLAWVGVGDLVTMTAAEAAGPNVTLHGDALVCAMYINELVLRLMSRHDPLPELFPIYTEALYRLQVEPSLAWSLRRFERDLLACLGYSLQLEHDADTGELLQPDLDYGYFSDHGPVQFAGPSDAVRISGRALLALGRDECPAAADLSSLRRLIRGVIRHQLGGAVLHSWGSGLAKMGRPDSP